MQLAASPFDKLRANGFEPVLRPFASQFPFALSLSKGHLIKPAHCQCGAQLAIAGGV